MFGWVQQPINNKMLSEIQPYILKTTYSWGPITLLFEYFRMGL